MEDSILNQKIVNHNGEADRILGVFDGHGGHGCAEFLRDNLHNIIANQSTFPQNPEKSLINGFKDIIYRREKRLEEARSRGKSRSKVKLANIEEQYWADAQLTVK